MLTYRRRHSLFSTLLNISYDFKSRHRSWAIASQFSLRNAHFLKIVWCCFIVSCAWKLSSVISFQGGNVTSNVTYHQNPFTIQKNEEKILTKRQWIKSSVHSSSWNDGNELIWTLSLGSSLSSFFIRHSLLSFFLFRYFYSLLKQLILQWRLTRMKNWWNIHSSLQLFYVGVHICKLQSTLAASLGQIQITDYYLPWNWGCVLPNYSLTWKERTCFENIS